MAAAFANWIGFYAGGHLGGGFGTSGLVNTSQLSRAAASSGGGETSAGPSGGTDTGGFLGGGQVGYNYQVDNVVIGVEADGSGADIHGSGGTVLISTAPPGGNVSAKTDLIIDVTGRLGLASGSWLSYAKGGAAWSANTYDLVTSTGRDWHWDGTHTGWTLGGGIEWAFRLGWSAKLEYQYYDFGVPGHVTNPAGTTSFGNFTQYVHTITAGLNYRFGT
jgi:outer membrane immunogenic protein